PGRVAAADADRGGACLAARLFAPGLHRGRLPGAVATVLRGPDGILRHPQHGPGTGGRNTASHRLAGSVPGLPEPERGVAGRAGTADESVSFDSKPSSVGEAWLEGVVEGKARKLGRERGRWEEESVNTLTLIGAVLPLYSL